MKYYKLIIELMWFELDARIAFAIISGDYTFSSICSKIAFLWHGGTNGCVVKIR